MKESLILVGGGGHCKSCIDVIESEGRFSIAGILDSPEKVGTKLLQYPVIGDDDSIPLFVAKGYSFLITIGQVKLSQKRRALYFFLKEKGAKLATVVAPSASISKYASVGAGTIVMHHAFINAGATVGNNVILNTNCLLEHDAVINDHVHVSTHAVVNGGVTVGENCFIGSNSVVVQNISIASEVTIGAGAVVTKNIRQMGTYVGIPAKQIGI